MAESANKKGAEKQTADSQHKVQDPESELHTATIASERVGLKETVEAKPQSLTDQQGKSEKTGDDLPEDLHRSERA
jgi:hypothetical protein